MTFRSILPHEEEFLTGGEFFALNGNYFLAQQYMCYNFLAGKM